VGQFLVQFISLGGSILSAIQQHGISINTAYSQIKDILAKTGTRRQAELIKLVIEHSPSLERRKNKMTIVAERRAL
jgi:DNA-binding CsgD family transcriptional regulator